MSYDAKGPQTISWIMDEVKNVNLRCGFLGL